MLEIEKINNLNWVSKKNIKNLLGYAVKERRGYYKDIQRKADNMSKTLDAFESVGFIKKGHTLKNETYSVTKLGDEYYMDMFGTYEYYKKRISGMFKRTMKEFIDRFFE